MMCGESGMQALRVVGLHEDGKSIVCEDPSTRTRFLLPADERLRAAARGDVARLGQIEIERESSMRPREIQTRIRAGESVEQVASSAGASIQRIERFAHPVLLERSRTADLAQSAHPVREDGPDVQTLGEIVAQAFSTRGQDYAQASWDSWRGDDGRWVVAVHWQAGRSDNRARWAFSPGAHGGTVTALDEHAEALLDPEAPQTRTLRAVAHRTVGVAPAADTGRALDAIEDEPVTGVLEGTGGQVVEAPLRTDAEDDTRELPRIPAADARDEAAPEAASSGSPAENAPARPAKGKNGHPTVPSWEDVLLGVRSQRANGG